MLNKETHPQPPGYPGQALPGGECVPCAVCREPLSKPIILKVNQVDLIC